jgi:hypothetical protein
MKRSAVMFIAIGGPKAHVTLSMTGRIGFRWRAEGPCNTLQDIRDTRLSRRLQNVASHETRDPVACGTEELVGKINSESS